MRALLIKDGEIVPLKDSDRRMRMSHIGETLINRGYEVDWITTNFDHASKTFRRSDRTKKTSTGIRVIQFASLGYRSNGDVMRLLHTLWFSVRVLVYLLRYGASYQLFIASFPTVESMFVTYLYCGLTRKELWIDIRDKWPPERHMRKRLTLVYGTYVKFNSIALSWVRDYSGLKLLAISDDLLKWFLNKATKLHAHDGYVCPLGSSIDWSLTSGHSDKKNLKIVYVGSLGDSYDIVGFVRALLEVPKGIFESVSLDIVGTGTNYRLLKDLSVMARMSGGPVIRLHGYRDSDFIGEICRRSQIGVVPHIEDGLVPNKVGEYLAYGLFILYTPRGSLERLVSKEIGLRLERDFRNLTDALSTYKGLEIESLARATESAYSASFYYKSYYDKLLPSTCINRG